MPPASRTCVRARPREIAAASGCSLPCSRPAASRSTSVSAEALDGAELDDAGASLRSACRSCRRRAVSTVSMPLQRLGVPDRTPPLAPRPVPTMIAIGVARPSAHGHAMIRTATALTSACARRGSGPHSAHATKASTATATTAGTNHAATRSASFWIGARLRCASPTIATICASSVSAPTRSARITKRAGAVDRAAVTRRRRRPSPPASVRPSPSTRQSRSCLQRRRRQPGPSRRAARAGDRRPGHRCERHVLFAAVMTQPRRLRRQAEQRPDRGARPAPRAQLQHLTEQHEHDDHRRGVEVGSTTPCILKACGKQPGGERCRRADTRYAAPTPSAISVNMLGLRLTIDCPATLKERPPGPEDDRRRERGGRSSSRHADRAGRRVLDRAACRPSRARKPERASTAAIQNRRVMSIQLGIWPVVEVTRCGARAPCRRSGTRPARRARSPGASGRCIRRRAAGRWQSARSVSASGTRPDRP